jgi:hypothetical protein
MMQGLTTDVYQNVWTLQARSKVLQGNSLQGSRGMLPQVHLAPQWERKSTSARHFSGAQSKGIRKGRLKAE